MMTLSRIQARLHALHADIGFDGRFCLTIEADPSAPCSITHWYRPARYAPMMHRTVAAGTEADCIATLERYVAGIRAARGTALPEYAIAAE